MTDSLSTRLSGGFAELPKHKFTEFFGTGTKYGRFGDTSDDPDTMILKRDQLKAGIDNFSKGMGDRVYYIGYFGEDGKTPIKGVPLKDDNGNVILPDLEDYKYRRVNDEWYSNRITALAEFEKRVDDEMEERVFSDELNSIVMGLSYNDYMAILQEGGGATVGMGPLMTKLDGTVATIRATPPGIEQTRSLSKLRWLVSKRLANIKRNKVNASTTSKNIAKPGVTDIPLTRAGEVAALINPEVAPAAPAAAPAA